MTATTEKDRWIEDTVELCELLHLRPLQAIVQSARRFESTIVVSYGETEANAKSILDLMEFAAATEKLRPRSLTIRASGPDASDAIRAISNIRLADFAQ